MSPFIQRLESRPLCRSPLGFPGEPPLRVVAYNDDVSVFISGAEEAGGGGNGDEAVC